MRAGLAGRGLASLFLMLLALAACTSAPRSGPPVLRNRTGQFTLLTPVKPAPATPVRALGGGAMQLDEFRGRVVVLNLWASWCAPCIYEMPALDRLAARSDPHRLAVLAVAIDREGAATVGPFLAARHLTHLAVYLDPDHRLASADSDAVTGDALPLWGLPITYIIDKAGRVIGYIPGATDWDSAEARNFLHYVLGQSAAQ